jgi:ribosome-associated translation inhibitor RaiA
MFAMNLGKLNVNEAELKAYIYQQLNDIQPYVGEAPVAIKMTYTNENEFFVKILANHEIGEIEAQGSHADVYSAISQAKQALIRSFSALDDEVESEEIDQRDAEIQSIINNTSKNNIH